MSIEVTVFTPTYNRARSIKRVFESLMKQSFNKFEWIIIDDGSIDNTEEIVQSFIKSANFPISYIYQENSGKHVAVNNAVKLAKGNLFIIADSDDAFSENSIEILVREWNNIPEKEKNKYKGITCRCMEGCGNKVIGKKFPEDVFDSNDLDIVFKYKCKYEMWGILRTDILKQYPFPEIKGLKFFPESIIWQSIARKYKTRYINDALRIYYRDQENAETSSKRIRAKENIYLWSHYINNTLDYYFYDIPRFIKAFIGISRDGLLLKMSPKEIVNLCNGYFRKGICILHFPIGYILALKSSRGYKKQINVNS